MRKTISYFMCIALLSSILGLTGCSTEPQISGPQKALLEFEKAFNQRDFEGVINAFKPSQQSELKLQMKLVQGFAGVAGDFFGLGGIDGIFSEDIIGGVFGIALEDYYIDIQVVDEVYNEDKTQATVTVKIISEDEEETDTIPRICVI